MAAETELIEVRDGRHIAVSEFGARDGTAALVYFHATTSSRQEGFLFDEAGSAKGVRVVALDRPSAGRSDPKPGRRLLDWPDDVADVADRLGLERFAVVGQSAGGPHTLACAHALADRVTVVVPINSSVPISWQPELAVDALSSEKFPLMARKAMPMMRLVLRVWGRLLRPQSLTPGRFARLLSLPPEDRELLAEPELWTAVSDSIREGTRQDRQIAMRELSLVYEKDGWGFDPYALSVPVVYFLGEKVGGEEFAKRIVAGCRAEGARLERFPGGHMGQLAPAVRERVVETVASFTAPAPSPS